MSCVLSHVDSSVIGNSETTETEDHASIPELKGKPKVAPIDTSAPEGERFRPPKTDIQVVHGSKYKVVIEDAHDTHEEEGLIARVLVYVR